MNPIKSIILGVVAISLLTFIALFGQLPALRRTPIGWLQRVLCLHLPSNLRRIDRRLTGGTITRNSATLGNYLFYQKNPLVLIIFLLLLTGCIILFLKHAIPKLPTSLLLPLPILISLPYTFTYLTANHRGHHITHSNQHLNDFPYDHALFRPAKTCKTCHLTKPARSKHCSLCGTCIAKCDHHCPWINNCVGRGNYAYFLALLLTLEILEIYGAYLGYYILQPHLTRPPGIAFFSSAYGNRLLLAIHIGGLPIAGVGLLCATTFLLPLGLLAYHCYLIWAGMTTNESQKWADWRDDISEGVVFKASRQALRTHNQLRRYDDAGRSSNPALDVGLREHEDAPQVSWPVSSDQVLVCTNNGRPPHGQEALWTRIWDLSEVENIYDLGGWDNFMDVFKGR